MYAARRGTWRMVGAYLFCSIVGLAWTVANFALGKVFDHAGGGDAAAADVSVSDDFGVGDAGGHGDAVTDGNLESPSPPLFSPTAIMWTSRGGNTPLLRNGNNPRSISPFAVNPLKGSLRDRRQPANKSCSACETFVSSIRGGARRGRELRTVTSVIA